MGGSITHMVDIVNKLLDVYLSCEKFFETDQYTDAVAELNAVVSNYPYCLHSIYATRSFSSFSSIIISQLRKSSPNDCPIPVRRRQG